jgi:hypothetical protein
MFEVKVTVDLGEKTVALLTGGFAVAKAPEVKEPQKCEEAKPLKALTDAKPPKGGYDSYVPKEPAPKAAKAPKAEPADANGWDELDDDAKLEIIKTEVTKHTKKGKSGDIKFLLANFDAGRASELSTDDYGAFYEAIKRYGKGESVDKIFPGLD